jgi:hypothetical protein
MGQFQMGFSRVLGAPQTGNISMHVLLSKEITNIQQNSKYFLYKGKI